MEPSATSTTVTGPVGDGEYLQAGTEDTPVLDCPAPFRLFHNSGAGYKYRGLLTYLLTYLPYLVHSGSGILGGYSMRPFSMIFGKHRPIYIKQKCLSTWDI